MVVFIGLHQSLIVIKTSAASRERGHDVWSIGKGGLQVRYCEVRSWCIIGIFLFCAEVGGGGGSVWGREAGGPKQSGLFVGDAGHIGSERLGPCSVFV